MGASCIKVTWPERWAGYARPRVYRDFWHGTLLQDKADGSGLNYRRNRYYDPATGRFTKQGGCKTYVPRLEWDAVGAQIRRIPNAPGKCEWIRSEMLSMWRRGPDAEHFRFWDGLDVLRRNAQGRPLRWRVGQYIHDPARPWFEFERRVFFESRLALPHEGLHMYYHHHPEPGLDYEVLHARIYREQEECRLR